MIKIGKESKLTTSDVVDKAVEFFGPGGLGLEVVEKGDCCARFEGSGGYVFVDVADADRQDGSSVDVEGREWDFHIKRFMGEI